MEKLDIIDMIGLLPILGVILLFFSVMVWGLIKDAIFRKKAVPISAKVIKVEKAINKAGEFIGYDVTFEFEYDGKVIKETVFSLEKFKLNSITTGLYEKGKKRNTLSIESAGFYVNKPAIWIFGFPTLLFLIFVLTHEMFDISKKVLFDVVFIYFAYIFISLYLITKKAEKSKTHKDSKKDIYNKVHHNEYSDVNPKLIRYIPKISKKRKASKSDSIIFQSIFIGLGSIGTILGIITTSFAIYVKFTYPSIIAEIIHIDTYTKLTSHDGEYHNTKMAKITHKYEIDGKEYTYIDHRDADLYFKEVGDETKFYYNKKNPNDIIDSNDLKTPFVMALSGILFVYVGINDIIDKRKHKRLYDTYVMLSKGDKE